MFDLILKGEFNKAIQYGSILALKTLFTGGACVSVGCIIVVLFKRRRDSEEQEEDIQQEEVETIDVTEDYGVGAILQMVSIADEQERPIDWWQNFIKKYKNFPEVKKACLNPMKRARKRQQEFNREHNTEIYPVSNSPIEFQMS